MIVTIPQISTMTAARRTGQSEASLYNYRARQQDIRWGRRKGLDADAVRTYQQALRDGFYPGDALDLARDDMRQRRAGAA